MKPHYFLGFLGRLASTFCLGFLCLSVGACSSTSRPSDLLNPFSDSSTADLGVRNNQPLITEGGGAKSEERARVALEFMRDKRRAQAPQPAYPVIQPAEVRLMWIPDHLNKHGDMIPQHFYYLKVLSDRWEVQDAFDVEKQLDEGSSSTGSSSATPWVYKKR